MQSLSMLAQSAFLLFLSFEIFNSSNRKTIFKSDSALLRCWAEVYHKGLQIFRHQWDSDFLCLSDPMDNDTCHSIEKVTKSQYCRRRQGHCRRRQRRKVWSSHVRCKCFQISIVRGNFILYALYKLFWV